MSLEWAARVGLWQSRSMADWRSGPEGAFGLDRRQPGTMPSVFASR